MNDNIVSAAKREQQELLAKRDAYHAEYVAKIAPVDQRLAELDIFLRVAETIQPSATARPAEAQPPLTRSVILDLRPTVTGGNAITFKDRVIAVTEELLSQQEWMKTKDIVKRLEAAGVTINTKADKVVRVSSILVKEKEKFASNRKLGWTLKQGRIDAPKGKGPNARTFSPLGSTSRGGQPTPAAQPGD